MTKLSPDHPFVAAVLNGERRWIVAHLYTFTSVGGTILFRSDWHVIYAVGTAVEKAPPVPGNPAEDFEGAE